MTSNATEMELREPTQSVCFEIANGTERQVCMLKTKFLTKGRASRYLKSNWPTIEKLARDALASGCIEDGQIKLVMK
jgi:hypothetical protein